MSDLSAAAVYLATLLSVTDGDTLRVRTPWVDTPFEFMAIRVSGVDTPETHRPQAKCADEIAKGVQAKAYVRSLVGPGDKLHFVLRGHDKYGQLLATVTLADGSDLGSTLITKGFAKAYSGGKKASWCPAAMRRRSSHTRNKVLTLAL